MGSNPIDDAKTIKMKKITYSVYPEIEKEEFTSILEKKEDLYQLILINDDHNTFVYVINCLMKYCKHSLEQAEQCAMITHNNKKCEVKRGSIKALEPIFIALMDAGLTVELQSK